MFVNYDVKLAKLVTGKKNSLSNFLFVLSFIEQLVTKPFCVPGSLPDSGLPELSKTEKPSAPCGAPAHPV